MTSRLAAAWTQLLQLLLPRPTSLTTQPQRWALVGALLLATLMLWSAGRGAADESNLKRLRDEAYAHAPKAAESDAPTSAKAPALQPAATNVNGEKRAAGAAAGACEPWHLVARKLVFVLPVQENADEHVDAVLSSWGADVGEARLAFVGKCKRCSFGADLPEGRAGSMTKKSFGMLPDAAQRFPDATLFVKVDLDTLVVPPNLFGWLHRRGFRDDEPLYVGSRQTYEPTGEAYNSGGASYILSRAAIAHLGACGFVLDHEHEDVAMGRCMAKAGIAPEHCALFSGERLEWLARAIKAHKKSSTLSDDYIVPRYPVALHLSLIHI